MSEFTFTTGVAGSGKTYQCQQRIAADPGWALLTSTTGISAVNLGTQTLNSTLGYFDYESLLECQKNGKLMPKLRSIREKYTTLGIDEISMSDGRQLDVLIPVCEEADLGLYITGDFLQLPPVKAPWAFESKYWSRFEKNTTKLTKVWRQSGGSFLDALNHARSGDGRKAVETLECEWADELDHSFEGITLISKNEEVDRFNQEALDRLPGPEVELVNHRWGRSSGEFKHIPESVAIKIGCYVNLLSNRKETMAEGILHANGDRGHVISYDGWTLRVKLLRTDRVVTIERVRRDVSRKGKPKGFSRPRYATGWAPYPHYDIEKDETVLGQICYWPLRLAYASTIHKSQGLSLDKVQLDLRDDFVGQPAMVYVALSRCRTQEGLRLVGTREQFVQRCKVDPKVRRWI